MGKYLRRIKGCIQLVKILLEVLLKKRIPYRFILIGSPIHGNIGDHAISIAERKFLLDHFSENAVIEIPGYYFKFLRRFLIQLVAKKDVILISGGGFLGSLWINEEDMVRQIILSFPQNSIYILPQTVFYSDDETGKTELTKSQNIYSTHKRLNIFLREKKSFEFTRTNFDKLHYIGYVPDMVLYLDFSKPALNRSGILFCFREDKEKRLSQNETSDIYAFFNEKGYSIVFTSTIILGGISFKCRDKILAAKLTEFKTSRLVITDRLHGMLFAAITATPCIALDNLSKKVGGVCEWISDLEYIKFAQSVDDIVMYSEQLLKSGAFEYDNAAFKQSLSGIAEEIRNNEGI